MSDGFISCLLLIISSPLMREGENEGEGLL